MNWHENMELALRLIPGGLLSTLYMVFVSAFFALVLGFPFGIALALTTSGGLHPNRVVYSFSSSAVNIGRSIPFAILILAIIPFTRWLVGTSLGTTASIVPLSLAAAPFVARIVESSLKGVSRGIIDAALVMGSSTRQIIWKVALREALPELVEGMTLMLITLVGYSAMAGLVGGGGLGRVAIQYGYQRFNGFIMLSTVVVLVLLVEAIQWTGEGVVRGILKKRGIQ